MQFVRRVQEAFDLILIFDLIRDHFGGATTILVRDTNNNRGGFRGELRGLRPGRAGGRLPVGRHRLHARPQASRCLRHIFLDRFPQNFRCHLQSNLSALCSNVDALQLIHNN